jgi:hypothetical protein
MRVRSNNRRYVGADPEHQAASAFDAAERVVPFAGWTPLARKAMP